MATVQTIASGTKDTPQVIQGMFSNIFQTFTPQAVSGFPINCKCTIAAADLANGNYILLTPLLPNGTHVEHWRGTPSDLDTDGTPAIVYDIVAVTVNSAGTVTGDVLTLVSGSTNGQAAAGSDSLLAACYGRHIGLCHIAMKITTPPDVAAAGTYKYAGKFYLGTWKPGVLDQPYIGDAEA